MLLLETDICSFEGNIVFFVPVLKLWCQLPKLKEGGLPAAYVNSRDISHGHVQDQGFWV